MIIGLIRYYLSLHYWHAAPIPSIKRMQLAKFKRVFGHACRHSKFYREYYGDHGVLDLQIGSLDDIRRIPKTDKGILRIQPIADIMTCRMADRIHIHSTSGSSGEPFRIAFDRYEDYTSHIRVFWALKKAGYRISDKIAILSRYNAEDKFEIEGDLAALAAMQKKAGLLQREIISIYEPVDEIISKLLKTSARVLWSTPSIMQMVGNRLREKDIRLDFPIIFLTSEMVSPMQKELFVSTYGKNIVNLYGTMESPSLGFDFGLADQFHIFPNSNYFEFEPVMENDSGRQIGNVVITNLLNRTMPIIRYDLNDFAEADGNPGFGYKYIKKIIGRQDDILELGNGKYLAHHHAHEMFMDFHECEMFKFVQKADKTIRLQLKISRSQDKSRVAELATARWRKRFADIPLAIEFVDGFEVNPSTGKFKNIERENGSGQPAGWSEAAK